MVFDGAFDGRSWKVEINWRKGIPNFNYMSKKKGEMVMWEKGRVHLSLECENDLVFESMNWLKILK